MLLLPSSKSEIFEPIPSPLRSVKMCWMIEQHFLQCGHWGASIMENPCAKGINKIRSCGENQVNAAQHRPKGLCSACTYQQSIELHAVTFTHRASPRRSPVPLSRVSVDEKSMTKSRKELKSERTARMVKEALDDSRNTVHLPIW